MRLLARCIAITHSREERMQLRTWHPSLPSEPLEQTPELKAPEPQNSRKTNGSRNSQHGSSGSRHSN